ncbi:hypothetical protein CYMTET_29736 [Cymbomonas tetramitiformis]|uniref:Uncharacterized protein n=1 Tax=Cymbomonas tetramitiformis TaxID=36881 RepID=A0AAE0FKD5_9CHLO|nr:hypothetical protein CYMTET_29736 [Cymbomonas tetramitiformis]
MEDEITGIIQKLDGMAATAGGAFVSALRCGGGSMCRHLVVPTVPRRALCLVTWQAPALWGRRRRSRCAVLVVCSQLVSLRELICFCMLGVSAAVYIGATSPTASAIDTDNLNIPADPIICNGQVYLYPAIDSLSPDTLQQVLQVFAAAGEPESVSGNAQFHHDD